MNQLTAKRMLDKFAASGDTAKPSEKEVKGEGAHVDEASRS